jgi:peptidoglycan/LPS O-acetylase OafA/YrhL
VFGVWLAGWSLGHGPSAWIALHAGVAIPPELAQAIGAVLLILATQGCPALAACLSGRAATWLGRLSFPIYLVHVPILCSAGCASYLAADRVLPGRSPAVMAILVTLVLTLAVAVPLARFDAWWTRRLSAWFAAGARSSSRLAAWRADAFQSLGLGGKPIAARAVTTGKAARF